MKLFGKKKDIRFESITIDRRREVFKALEARGWTQCADTYQFDMDRTPEKLRKIAKQQAKDLKAELLVEIWDPIFQRTPYRGLSYSAWRKMTPEEVNQKMVEKALRPDYSDTMGSIEDLEKRIYHPQAPKPTEDIRGWDTMVQAPPSPEEEGETYGTSEEDMGMTHADFETVSVMNPYDHQGESDENLRIGESDRRTAGPAGVPTAQGGMPGVRSGSEPVFESSMRIDTGIPRYEEKVVDPLALMMEAAEGEKRTETAGPPQPSPPPQQQPSSHPAAQQQNPLFKVKGDEQREG